MAFSVQRAFQRVLTACSSREKLCQGLTAPFCCLDETWREEWSLSRILRCLVAKLLIPSVSIASIQRVKWQVRGRLICSFICWVPHPVFCFSHSPSPLEEPKRCWVTWGWWWGNVGSLGQTSWNSSWFKVEGEVKKRDLVALISCLGGFLRNRSWEFSSSSWGWLKGLKLQTVFLARIFFSVIPGLMI